MTYEMLLKPMQAERKPYLLILFTFLITTISILLAYKIFPRSSSVLIITFCIMPLIPIMVKLMEIEELRFEKNNGWSRIKNYRILKIYAYLFLGFVIAFSFWYTALPIEKSSVIFSEQIDSLYEREPIDSRFSGEKVSQGVCDSSFLTGYIDEYDFSNCVVHDYYKDGNEEYLIWLQGDRKPSLVYEPSEDRFTPYRPYVRKYYFMNNFRLLIFVFLTSFIFGSGALFILTWNASIIGVYIGEAAIRSANSVVSLFSKVPAYFGSVPFAMGRLLLHGIPEFLGFFISALAGGILSAAILRHKFRDRAFIRVLLDSLALFAVSVVLIFAAAVIESFVI